jgi:toxin ParE1/3/4
MNIILSTKAKFNLKHIYNYIAKENVIGAKKTLDKLYNIIELIAQQPYIGIVGRVENTREFFIPQTNYFIIYKIENNNLYIMNVIHSARNY